MEWSEKKSTGEVLTNKLRTALMFTQEGRCHVCRVEEWRLKKKLQAHRVIPGKWGGKYVFENVVLVCGKCHRKIEGLSREEINRIRGAK